MYEDLDEDEKEDEEVVIISNEDDEANDDSSESSGNEFSYLESCAINSEVDQRDKINAWVTNAREHAFFDISHSIVCCQNLMVALQLHDLGFFFFFLGGCLIVKIGSPLLRSESLGNFQWLTPCKIFYQ